MNLLAGKHQYLFEEDDEDYAKLKQYSEGISPSDKKIIFCDGYSKGCIVNTLLQSTFPVVQTLSRSVQLNTKEFEVEFDLAKIFNVPPESSDSVSTSETLKDAMNPVISVVPEQVNSLGKTSNSVTTQASISTDVQINSSANVRIPEVKFESAENVKNDTRSPSAQMYQSKSSPFFTVAVVFIFILLVFGVSYTVLKFKKEEKHEIETETDIE